MVMTDLTDNWEVLKYCLRDYSAVSEHNKWCTAKELSVNPDKMEVVLFTNSKKVDRLTTYSTKQGDVIPGQ
jgi:hypothetical protein